MGILLLLVCVAFVFFLSYKRLLKISQNTVITLGFATDNLEYIICRTQTDYYDRDMAVNAIYKLDFFRELLINSIYVFSLTLIFAFVGTSNYAFSFLLATISLVSTAIMTYEIARVTVSSHSNKKSEDEVRLEGTMQYTDQLLKRDWQEEEGRVVVLKNGRKIVFPKGPPSEIL